MRAPKPSLSRFRPAVLAACLLQAAIAVPAALAATPDSLLQQWRAEAGSGAPAFAAARGRSLFETRGADWSCSSCHTTDPRQSGRHVVTGKTIQPLAPGANPQRFTDDAKVAKWMRRNCRDVLGRECTPQQKGDVLTWLLSVGK